MERKLKYGDDFREADCSNRIKMMLKQAQVPDYLDATFEDGDKVYCQNRETGVWEGPYEVKSQVGKNVKVIVEDSIHSYPTNRI